MPRYCMFLVFLFLISCNSTNRKISSEIPNDFQSRLNKEMRYQIDNTWKVYKATIQTAKRGEVVIRKDKELAKTNLFNIVVEGILNLHEIDSALGEKLLEQMKMYPNIEVKIEDMRMNTVEKVNGVWEKVKNPPPNVYVLARQYNQDAGAIISFNLNKFNFGSEHWKKGYVAPIYFATKIRTGIKNIFFHEYMHSLRVNKIKKEGVSHNNLSDEYFNYRALDPIFSCTGIAHKSTFHGLVGKVQVGGKINYSPVTRQSCDTCYDLAYDDLTLDRKKILKCYRIADELLAH